MPLTPKSQPAAIPRLCAVLVGGSIILWIARWAAFPVALDPAYHLLIVEQMRAAGGVLCWDAWQYAPIGRPHLYPPALHLTLLALIKLGLPSLTALRLLTALLVPGVILAVGRLGRALGGSRAGWLTAATAALTWPFLRHAATALAGALGMIELCALLIAVYRGRWLAAAAALTLLHYTHLGLPVIAWIALALLALIAPESRRTIGQAAALGLALSAPWLLHLLRHRSSIQVLQLIENTQLTWMVGLWMLALVGLVLSARQARAWRWALALLAAFVPLALRYPYRWVQGEGLLPIVLLAGLGLAAITERLEQRKVAPWWSAAAALLAAVVALSFGITWTPQRVQVGWAAPGIVRLVDLRSTDGDLDAGIYGPLMTELRRAIEQTTRPGEIIWSNLPYGVGAAAALARRPMSAAMLPDVKPAEPFDAVAAAHLIVWFNVPRWPGWPDLPEVIERYRLEPVAETALARLYRNPAAAALARAPRAVGSPAGADPSSPRAARSCVPFGFAFVLLCGLLLLMLVDLRS